MTRKIELTFRVTCRRCGQVTSFDAPLSDQETLNCAACKHPFSVPHQLVRSLHRRVDEFLQHMPEEDVHRPPPSIR